MYPRLKTALFSSGGKKKNKTDMYNVSYLKLVKSTKINAKVLTQN